MNRSCANKQTLSVRAGELGFSLIEIMVVVLLIAITATLITVNLERNLDEVAGLEARRFASLLEHVRDESIISGKTYAIEVDEVEKSYSFLQPGKTWTQISSDDVLRKRYFPEYLNVQFDVVGEVSSADEGQTKSLLVIQNLGEITPFSLVISGDQFQQVVDLDDSQNIVVKQVDRETS